MENWNPWYGCHKCSRGCEHCYVENLNKLYDKDFNEVKFSYGNFSKIDKKDEYRDFIIPAGTIINVCETSDFFLEEVYEWRVEAWKKIKNRDDLFFIINTRRVENIFDSLPSDWGDGYDNVAIVFNVSDQKTFDLNIENFLKLKIKHKRLNLCPILEKMNIIDYLDGIEEVYASGENGKGSRMCNFDWILNIKEQCENKNVSFIFSSTGTNFVKNNKKVFIPYNQTNIEAEKYNINYKSK